MKTKNDHTNPELEKRIMKRDAELKSIAKKTAIHLADRNLPALEEIDLSAYIGEIKTGYESLSAETLHTLLPETIRPQLVIEVEEAKAKDDALWDKERELNTANKNDKFELHDFHGESLKMNICLVLTAILLCGDAIWNTVSFQVTGMSLLFAFFMSTILSFSIFICSHVFPIIYKEIRLRIYRRLYLAGVFILMTGVFYVLSLFRAKYLAHFGQHISLWNFVIINHFAFIVSFFLSLILFPDWHEFKRLLHQVRLKRLIRKRNEQLIKIGKERAIIKQEIKEKGILYMKKEAEAKRLLSRIRAMYFEAVEIFKSTNRMYRGDKLTPKCFSQETPEPDIQFSSSPLITFNTTKQ